MKKSKPPMFRVILNEQTPKTQRIQNTKQWIQDNETKLNSFLMFSRSKKKAAGLAANQVAFKGKRILDRFFAVRRHGNSKDWTLIINPEIKSVNGDPQILEEGCLTWPGKTIVAERYPGIIVSFWEMDGTFVENLFIEEYEAQVWQHEINHLDGQEEKFKQTQTERREKDIGRNEQCPCGSGKKYKKCCGK